LGVGDKKFISSNLIKRFLNSTEIFYGDIGVRFAKKGKEIVIASINQMRINKNLKVGDVIKKIDGKTVKNLQDLENKILFTKRNQSIKLEFLRKNALHAENIKVFQKNGGGEASDSFLEAKGMFFDKNLSINKIFKDSFADKKGLKIGDRLVQIDRKSVKNQNDARIVFSKTKKKSIYLLFDRGGSQFFIKVDK
jgi:C-terminal processing protease CtpA/Prc